MKQRHAFRRFLSAVLAAVICLVLTPPAALSAAAESAYTQVTDAAQLTAGGQFVLVAAHSGPDGVRYYAVGTVPDRKLDAVAVTVETDSSTLPLWTVEGCEGGISLKSGETYLTYGTDAYFGSAQTPATWSVTEVGTDTFRFTDEASGHAIAYNDNNGDGRFGPYALSNLNNNQYSFDLLVYQLSKTETPVPEETTEPEASSAPLPTIPDGAYVVWAPALNMALSGEKESTYYHKGVPVAEADGLLTGYANTEIWELVNNGDGTVTLLFEGWKLSLTDNYDSPQWDGPNDSWNLLEQADGTWLVQNAGRPNRYLGWNSSLQNWSAHPLPEEQWDGFSLRFTPVERLEEVLPAQEVQFSPDGGELYTGGSPQITLTSATEGAQIYYATSTDGETYTEYVRYSQPISPEKGFGTLWVKAYASADGFSNSSETLRCFTERMGYYGFYFGQLHAHTNISDGQGSVMDAFAYASQVEGLDFLAVTDHSNSFDNGDLGILGQDGTAVSEAWKAGREAAEAATTGEFVGLYGFEMTWNNGLGHINTFNTPGWLSRNQADFAKPATALENYYDALAAVSQSISQFNHPGTTYGDFQQFGHYSAQADRVITLIEVGNGETGSAYEYYIQALDQGWHLAPTNNQNNHTGHWGDADSGRTVILANSLSEANIYDALRNYRVYATEDSDLEIYYTLNENLMGSRLFAFDSEIEVTLSVTVSDATDASIGTVEVIADGGACIASQSMGASGTVQFTVPTGYSYYFIRITQPDGDTAVTAPVWVETVEAVGISRFEADSTVTAAGEEQTFTAELFNNAKTDLLLNSFLVTDKATGEVLYESTGFTVPGEGTVSRSFSHIFDTDGIYTLVVTATGTLDGMEKSLSRELEVTVLPETIISDVIVDGTHGGIVNADNLIAIAAAEGIKSHVETREITAAQLEGCALLVIPAPESDFDEAFLSLIGDYVKNGGNVILCGTSDAASPDGAQRLNGLLSAIGSTMTLSDDRAYDPAGNGGTPGLLFPGTFREESPWTEGIWEGQVYSHREGCSVNAGSGSWLVMGLDTTFSVDGDFDGRELSGETHTEIILSDADGAKEIVYDLVKNPGAVCLLAVEETAGGSVFLSGSAFLWDDSMQLQTDNSWDLPYANCTIFENILGITRTQPVITPIAEVRDAEDGRIFMIEGYVTAGTVSPNTTFRDTIYLQDDTSGIAAIPYSTSGLALGTRLRITGCTETNQGDRQFRILSMQILEEPRRVIAPAELDNRSAMDYEANGGTLVQIQGEVVEVIPANDGLGVSQFLIKDASGNLATVYIENYIFSGTTGTNTLSDIVKVGNRVSAIGLVYRLEQTLLRVRDCDEVVLLWANPGTGDNPPTGDETPVALWSMTFLSSLIAIAFLLRKART